MSQDARQGEEQATQRRARILGLSYIDTSTQHKPLFKELLTVDELRKLKVIPIQVNTNAIVFGVTNTTSQQTITGLKQRFIDQKVSHGLISDAGYREYMKLYDPPKQVTYQDISVEQTTNTDLQEAVSVTLAQVKADDMLAYLTQQAHKLDASDIHLETQKDHVRIRFRIDGVLHAIATLKPDKYRILTSAIASAGNVSTASDEPQQGHISQTVTMADGAKVQVNLRLETAPTINGMDVVMRLFNMSQEKYTLERLGLTEPERQVVDGIIAKPSGLVLVVGPTGSGKTTTVYSMLNSLNQVQRKLITIEDPVEYQFDGISQISVTTQNSHESSFADKLRAILRLDPDIVMVGEIRDMDTAKTALQASLTGHLVLSTFHASNSSAALMRLMDVIGKNTLFVGAIRLIMAQRLVRRLDDATKQAYTPDQATLKRLLDIIDTMPADLPKPDLTSVQLYKPGKSAENPFGFKGQVALREQFMITGKVQELLESGQALSTKKIQDVAVSSGMQTMLHKGVAKVLAGETTLEEVFRVLG